MRAPEDQWTRTVAKLSSQSVRRKRLRTVIGCAVAAVAFVAVGSDQLCEQILAAVPAGAPRMVALPYALRARSGRGPTVPTVAWVAVYVRRMQSPGARPRRFGWCPMMSGR